MADEKKPEETKEEKKPEEKKDVVPATTETDKDAKPAGEKPKGAAKQSKLKTIVEAMSPREKNVLRAAAILFGLLMVDLMVMRPIGKYLDRLNEMIHIEEKIIPKKLMILSYKEKIMNEFETLKAFVIDPSITQEGETAEFLREIERVSQEVNLFVSNINTVEVNQVSETVYELSVDIEGTGGIHEIREFMKTLETTNPEIRIEGFNLKPKGKASDQLQYAFSINKIGVRQSSVTEIDL